MSLLSWFAPYSHVGLRVILWVAEGDAFDPHDFNNAHWKIIKLFVSRKLISCMSLLSWSAQYSHVGLWVLARRDCTQHRSTP